jgi:hypothetical protein
VPPPDAAARAGSGCAPSEAKAMGFADTEGTRRAGGAGPGRAAEAAKPTGGGTRRAPDAAKTTGSARPRDAWGTDAGGAGTRAAKSARRPRTVSQLARNNEFFYLARCTDPPLAGM